jgi:hypothetical protein
MKYKLLSAKFSQLEKMVNSYIEDGWTPLGGLTTDGPELVQAMIKYDVEDYLGKPNLSDIKETEESKLKEMMKDPRYWKEKDPKFREQVEEGFKRLYS